MVRDLNQTKKKLEHLGTLHGLIKKRAIQQAQSGNVTSFLVLQQHVWPMSNRAQAIRQRAFRRRLEKASETSVQPPTFTH